MNQVLADSREQALWFSMSFFIHWIGRLKEILFAPSHGTQSGSAHAGGFRELADDMKKLASRARLFSKYFPSFGASEDFAKPHIEVDDRGFHFVVVERGKEWERRNILLENPFSDSNPWT